MRITAPSRSRFGMGERAATVSTYVVRFVSFLAEYFSWHPFHPMFTGIRRGLLAGSTLALRSNTAPSRSRLGDALNLPSRDREGVGGRYRRTVWFRLRRVRKRRGTFASCGGAAAIESRLTALYSAVSLHNPKAAMIGLNYDTDGTKYRLSRERFSARGKRLANSGSGLIHRPFRTINRIDNLLVELRCLFPKISVGVFRPTADLPASFQPGSRRQK